MRLRPALLIPGVLASLGLTITALGIQNTAGGTSAPHRHRPRSRSLRQRPQPPNVDTRGCLGRSSCGRTAGHRESALRDPATPANVLPDLGHQQQVIYRVLSKDRPRSQRVVTALPTRWKSIAERHLAARREFLRMSRGRGPSTLPAWRIIQPEPAEQLISYYRKAEAATGIEWGCSRP